MARRTLYSDSMAVISRARWLMGHSQLETTRMYLDEIGIDDLADALARAAGPRPVKWCARLEASSSLEFYAAWAIVSTSSGSCAGGESAF